MAIGGVGSSAAAIQWDPTKAASNLFAKIDTSGQGYIDKSELQAAFDKISSDGQGSASDVDDFFSAVDTDNDGKITQQELTSSFQQVADALNAQFDSSRVARASSDGTPPAQPSVDDIFSSLDTKNQGYLDKDELQAALNQTSGSTDANAQTVDQIFQALDTDGDNQISKSELSAAFDNAAASPATQDASASASAGSTQAASAQSAGGAHGGGGAESASSSTTYDPADTNQDGVVSPEEQALYDLKQGVSSDTQSAQGNLDSILKVVSQLAKAYGQFDTQADTSNASVSTTA